MKTYRLTIDDQKYTVDVLEMKEGRARVSVGGEEYKVEIECADSSAQDGIGMAKGEMGNIGRNNDGQAKGETGSIGRNGGGCDNGAGRGSQANPGKGVNTVKSPLPGIVIEVCVAVGQEVKAGEKLAVLEAMKMENEIQAEESGVVREIYVKPGDSVPEGHDIVAVG